MLERPVGPAVQAIAEFRQPSIDPLSHTSFDHASVDASA
jgi:hypothetical protein